nr:MAG TPA: hypothetical protein [Caudoviricetes sp.]
MYSLNLDTDGRVLAVCECLDGVEYDIAVEAFPDGNVRDYKYINGEFIHDPLPKPEKEPTAEEDALSMIVDHEYRLTLLELGVTE